MERGHARGAFLLRDVCVLLGGGASRSWIKEQKAKDPNWVEPWIEKEREAKKAAKAANKAPSVSERWSNACTHGASLFFFFL